MVAIREHFGSEGRGRDSEWARQRLWFIKAKHDHQRREEHAERVDDNAAAFEAAVSVAATPIQIKEFEETISIYDTAIVQALMENEQLREAVTQKLAQIELDILGLLGQAHVLEDGRRVFKSEDGSFVIDEFGEDVSPDEVDFDLVTGPTAETYLAHVSERHDLEQERDALNEEHQQLLKAQEQIDLARDRIAEGDLTVDELEAMDAEILELMPDSARIHAGLETTKPDVVPTPDNTNAAPSNAVRTVSQDVATATPTPF